MDGYYGTISIYHWTVLITHKDSSPQPLIILIGPTSYALPRLTRVSQPTSVVASGSVTVSPSLSIPPFSSGPDATNTRQRRHILPTDDELAPCNIAS